MAPAERYTDKSVDKIAEVMHTPVPRPTKLTGVSWVLLTVFLSFLAVGIIAGALNQRQLRRGQLLASEGVEAEATITRLWRTSGRSTRFMMSYRFEAGSAKLLASSQMLRQTWSDLYVGERLPILYLPSQPNINKPVEGADGPVPLLAGWLLAAAFALVAVLMLRPIRREFQLLSSGIPAEAKVTDVKPGSKGGAIVCYEFKPPSGELTAGQSTRPGGQARIGESVCVLYDPENPQSSCLYPSQYVRLAVR